MSDDAKVKCQVLVICDGVPPMSLTQQGQSVNVGIHVTWILTHKHREMNYLWQAILYTISRLLIEVTKWRERERERDMQTDREIVIETSSL